MRPYVYAFFITVCLVVTSATAQVIRVGTLKPKPQLTLGDTLTVSATPSAVNIILVSNGTAVATSSITINTTSTGLSLFSSFALYAYFSTAATALTGGVPVTSIPTSAVLGRCSTRNTDDLHRLYGHSTVWRRCGWFAGLLFERWYQSRC